MHIAVRPIPSGAFEEASAPRDFGHSVIEWPVATTTRRRRASGRRLALRALIVACTTVVALALAAAPASAGFMGFMSDQGLSAGNLYAANTADAHSTDTVSGNSNHTWCPAVSEGVRGYASSAPLLGYGACGPGYQFTDFCNCRYNRGTAYNPNQSTYDFIYYANWYW